MGGTLVPLFGSSTQVIINGKNFRLCNYLEPSANNAAIDLKVFSTLCLTFLVMFCNIVDASLYVLDGNSYNRVVKWSFQIFLSKKHKLELKIMSLKRKYGEKEKTNKKIWCHLAKHFLVLVVRSWKIQNSEANVKHRSPSISELKQTSGIRFFKFMVKHRSKWSRITDWRQIAENSSVWDRQLWRRISR